MYIVALVLHSPFPCVVSVHVLCYFAKYKHLNLGQR